MARRAATAVVTSCSASRPAGAGRSPAPRIDRQRRHREGRRQHNLPRHGPEHQYAPGSPHVTTPAEESMSRRSLSRRRRNSTTAWWRTSATAVVRHTVRFTGAAGLALAAAFFGAVLSTYTARAQDNNTSTRQYYETSQQQVADIFALYESQPSNETRCDMYPPGPNSKRVWACTTAPPGDQEPQSSAKTLALKTAALNVSSRMRDRNLADLVDEAVYICSKPRPVHHDFIKEEEYESRWPDEVTITKHVAWIHRMGEPCRTVAEEATEAMGVAIRAL